MLNARRADGERVPARDQDGWRTLSRLATIVTLALLVATAGASLATFHWIADLGTHFPVQYAGLGLLAFVVLAWRRRVIWAVLALIVAAINAAIAAPGFSNEPVPLNSAEGSPLRVTSVNVLYVNRRYERVIDFAVAERPDIIVLSEIDERWGKALERLKELYPHSFATRGDSGRGLVLLSRLPLEQTRVMALEDAGEPGIETTVRLGDQQVRLFGVHASWPMGRRTAELRNRQLAQLAQAARSRSDPLILIGDLNVSPFSPYFARLLAESGLRSAAEGFGWQPTWPTLFPPAGIQIDHALVSSDVAVKAFRRGPFLGSDHRPISVDLVVRAR